MNRQHTHNREIVAQFTQQAVPFTTLPGHLNAMEKIVAMARVNAHSRVLDVAAGPGLVAAALARTAAHVECLDLTPAMLEQARAHAHREGLTNLGFREGDALALPYPDGIFDAVVTRYSFHHFLHPERVFTEMLRVCAPGGRVVVTDVAIGAEHSKHYDCLERLRDSSHVGALTPERFEALFTRPELENPERDGYAVQVRLEDQLAVSFTDDADEIREIIARDIGRNRTGTNPRRESGELWYSYPIAIFAADKAI